MRALPNFVTHLRIEKPVCISHATAAHAKEVSAVVSAPAYRSSSKHASACSGLRRRRTALCRLGLQRGGDRAEPQEQREQSSALPATPDSNATTLVLPGLRSDQENEPESQVSKVSVSSEVSAHGSPAGKAASEDSCPRTPAL